MSSDRLIYLVSVNEAERDSLSRYLLKHQFNIEVFSSLAECQSAVDSKQPGLIVLAGSSIPSPEICKFGFYVESKQIAAPIIALLTKLQMSIVSEMAESENLWTAEYPIALREIRASIVEAFQELEQG